jgi:hypothetical protein
MRTVPLFFLMASAVFAQTPAPTPNLTPIGMANAQSIWRCILPGGTYEVAVRAITAVSSHEYLVDGVARVTEVNIDTTGALLARFYYLEPNIPNTPLGIGAAAVEKAQQLVTEAAERTGQDVWKKVVKNYPTTTHARTVEYRVEKKEQLTTILESAEEAFRLNRSKSLTIQ